jgi:pimeloyl-ACP methyl ester carboxylesterase
MAAGTARTSARLASARAHSPATLRRQHRPAAAPRSCGRRRTAAVVAQAQHASHVRMFGGLAAETLGSYNSTRRDPSSTPAVKLRVGVLPGNPGVAAYYADFAEALQLELGPSAAVCGASFAACALPSLTDSPRAVLGLLGHSRQPLHARTFNLDEQVAHVVRFVDDACADADADTPFVLVGHSIGAWLALQALQKRPERVQCVAGLFPFLQNNSTSRLQRVLSAAVKLRPLVWLVAQLMSLLALLPARLRRALLSPVLRGVGGLEEDAVAVTCDWLRAWSVDNTCTLGAAEFAALAGEPDWAALQQHASRISLFYGGEEDIWGPPFHAAAVRRNAPDVAVVEDDTHGHMFCVTREGSRYVAAATAGLLRSMLASRAAEPVTAR